MPNPPAEAKPGETKPDLASEMKAGLKKAAGVSPEPAATPAAPEPKVESPESKADPKPDKPGEAKPADIAIVDTPPKPAEPAPVEPPKPAPKKIQRPDPKDFIAAVVAPVAPVAAPALGFTPTTDEADYLETVKFGEATGAIDKGTAAAEIARLTEARATAARVEAQWRRENPGQNYNAATAELEDGTRLADMQSRPAVDPVTRRILERKKDLADAKAIADSAAAQSRAEAARMVVEKDLRGKLAETAATTQSTVLDGVKLDEDPEIDAEMKKIAREQGMAALAAAVPTEEVRIGAEAAAKAAEEVEAFVALRAGVIAFNPEKAGHREMAQVIYEEGNAFVAAGAPLPPSDPRHGKIFLPLSGTKENPGYDQIKPEMRHRYATFTDQECQQILEDRAKRNANAAIAAIQNGKKKAEELRAKVRQPKNPSAPALQTASGPAPEPKPDGVKLAPTPQGAPTSEKREAKGNPFAIKPTVWPKR